MTANFGESKAWHNTRGGTTTATATGSDNWPVVLAGRLFNPPLRWGWQAAPPAPAAPQEIELPPRPVWTEPAPPDTSPLRAARSKATARVTRRVAVTVIAAFAFVTYQLVIEQQVQLLGSQAVEVYAFALPVLAILAALWILGAANGVRYATAKIRKFEQPYRAFRDAEQQRFRQTLANWEQGWQEHQQRAAEATRVANRLANGPRWYPVAPASEPTRLDVLGGDPRRHGWASLLVTLGTSVLSTGQRVTVLDLTGQDVGGGLAQVARAAGHSAHVLELGRADPDVDLLAAVGRAALPDCLAHALTARTEPGDRREERATVGYVLGRAVEALNEPVTFARLAAAVHVLRQGTHDDRLSPDETDRLVAVHIGDLDQSEWMNRQLRLLISQLEQLADIAPARSGRPLWTSDPVTVLATEGGAGDRKEITDRFLIRILLNAIESGWIRGLVAVAGADHLGAETLQTLSATARQSGVRLALLIDQPQGELEKTVGTGGAVCIMKMYNHRDANLAAEFIGKGHRFVLNQITQQIGKSLGESGGDNFAVNTGDSNTNERKHSRMPGRQTGMSDSRGHTWTGTRGWTSSDNISTSTSSTRVYEFVVEPHELLGMPETSFILVDNSGRGRRVVMADANPGICLLDRVSPTPAE